MPRRKETIVKFFLIAACAMLSSLAAPAMAGSQPYLGEVDTFAFNFCPTGWAPLNGQLLAISVNEPLFNLIGTTFGGDGKTTFALPLAKPTFTLSSGSPQLHQCIALVGIFPSDD